MSLVKLLKNGRSDVYPDRVQCDDAVALERIRSRNRDPADSFFLREGSIAYLRQRFEPLGADEAYELVPTG